MWATSPGKRHDNWTIEHNVILNGFSSAANHGGDINNNYGYLDNLTIRYNWFEGRESGTASIVVLNGPCGPYYIYGNVFKNMTGGDGVITGVWHPLSGAIFNNTFDNVNSHLVGAVFSVYPNVLPASTGEQFSLNIYNASAGAYGLQVGLIWWSIGITIAITYFVLLYRAIGGKIKLNEGH